MLALRPRQTTQTEFPSGFVGSGTSSSSANGPTNISIDSVTVPASGTSTVNDTSPSSVSSARFTVTSTASLFTASGTASPSGIYNPAGSPIVTSGSSGPTPRSNVGIVVGSALGGLIAGLLLALVIWCCCCRKKRRTMMIVNGRLQESELDSENSHERPSPMLQVVPASTNVRVMNWLSRMNSQKSSATTQQRSRASQYSSDPPDYRSRVTAPSDSASMYSQPASGQNPFGSGSERTEQRQADFLMYDIGHLKN
ncbi:hypothetical protein PM082_000717 [Marasmius tenuissimus]|nr:hypothetical protein PM082_000717 [Marasmius tenuissimus]